MLKRILIKTVRLALREADAEPVSQLLPQEPQISDVFLASFPKSGNTWARWLLAHGIAEHLCPELQVNWSTIQHLIPDVGVSRAIPAPSPFGVPTVPRILKTHAPRSPAFIRSIVLVRHPHNTLASYYTFLHPIASEVPSMSLAEFVRSEKFGAPAWNRYYQSWTSMPRSGQIVRIYQYEQLLESTAGILSQWLAFIGVTPNAASVARAVEKSSAENMKRSERDFGTNTKPFLAKRSFVGVGQNNRYISSLTDDDKRYIDEVCEATWASLQTTQSPEPPSDRG